MSPRENTNKKGVILDLSILNKYIQCDRFRMLTTTQIRTLLLRGSFRISIDFTDAYWHAPVARYFSPYLGYAVDQKVYACKTMLFGLNIAPNIFTKLADAVVQELRKKGIQLAAYLDN